MTGYGRSESGDSGNQVSVEVRSLNNRYLDIQVKAPRGFAALEARIKKLVQDRFSRGRFDIFISRNNGQERSGRLIVDEALAMQYVSILKDLKARFGLAGEVDVNLVAGMQDVISLNEMREDPEALWMLLSTGLSRALDELDRMRSEEGATLVHDIRDRLAAIKEMLRKITNQAPVLVEGARKRMTETLSRILSEQPDPARLAQEIAILAERTDITEELTRLGSHLSQFVSMLDATGRDAVGRKLDFLLQEMGREVNTIASKAMDVSISHDAVNIKAELEKIREQAQNIE